MLFHLGNLKFKSGTSAHSESSELADSNQGERISRLLGVNKFDLGEALTKKIILAQGDQITSTFSNNKLPTQGMPSLKASMGSCLYSLWKKSMELLLQIRCKTNPASVY